MAEVPALQEQQTGRSLFSDSLLEQPTTALSRCTVAVCLLTAAGAVGEREAFGLAGAGGGVVIDGGAI